MLTCACNECRDGKGPNVDRSLSCSSCSRLGDVIHTHTEDRYVDTVLTGSVPDSCIQYSVVIQYLIPRSSPRLQMPVWTPVG
jgi:hypothetical protein